MKSRAIFHKKLVVSFPLKLLFSLVLLFSALTFSLSSTAIGNEFRLLIHLCGSAAKRFVVHLFEKSPDSPSSFKGVPPSQYSWYLNRLLLSQIPADSREERQLIHFLENRWLAKTTGFFTTAIDWFYPCFGIFVQVHPETTSHYARNPSNKISQNYKNRVEAWKKTLPHPEQFPLILTRPSGVEDYLPSYFTASENVQTTVGKLASQATKSRVILDLTSILPKEKKKWLNAWKVYQDELIQACKERHLKLSKILCIQRVQQKEIGGLRLLPFDGASAKKIDRQHQFLLEWISHFGLSANRVELDRWVPPSDVSTHEAAFLPMEKPSKEEFLSWLDTFEWPSTHPQKTLMLKGALQVLKQLFANVTEEKWSETINCLTRASVVQLSMLKIKEQLQLLAEEADDVLFFDAASRIEQIHAHLTSLLEIFSPFKREDFSAIYENLLTCIPSALKPLTSYSVHASGMTSMAGILKAVERTLGAPPRVLYGENAYFECIKIAELVSTATPILEATQEDWKHVDLIIAQFNPALKRVNLLPTEYKVEKIEETLRTALETREGKALTIALDCTLDFIDSSRIGELLNAFQKEIETGILNVICYRSGHKFDLFGMDNYCGAPFYMIHNRDPKWSSFNALSTDPALQTDRLSLNWFCLAYQSAAAQLEIYRKQIFDNTRALLNKIPSRLFSDGGNYRVMPVEQDADIAFVDIKISGRLHRLKGSALVGGCLYMTCMEGGHPIFHRPSLGFYHPNYTVIFSEENTTIRLTLGLDPTQVDLLAGCFEVIDALNGPVRPSRLAALQSP